MKNLLKALTRIAVCSVSLSASVTLAQVDEIIKKPGIGGRYFVTGDPYKLVQKEEVQKELGLTDDQMSAVEKMVQECYADEDKTILKRASSMEEEQKRYLEWDDRTQKRVNDILSPEQQARMQEISIQSTGPRSLIRKDIVEKLRLSEEQQQKLLDAVFRRNAYKRTPGSPPETREELETTVKAILTDEQNRQFDKLKGKKISFDPDKLKLH